MENEFKKNLRPVIHVDSEKCVNCQRCIAVCPVKMCNNGSGNHVDLDENLCIGCGACIQVCGHGARTGIDDSEAFFSDLKSGKGIVAVVAPAAAVTFEGMDLELNGFLKSLGVRAVFDVSFGAELTTKSYIEYMKRKQTDCVISQPCPALVTFIEIYHPELIPYLAPVDSPMLHVMKAIREFYPRYSDCRIAAISPCYAKRREFDETGTGDYNVAMVSVKKYLEDNRLNLSSFGRIPYENPPAERAVLYSSPGGLMRTAERFVPGISERTRKIEGNPKVYEYLADFAEENSGRRPYYTLIDCLSCENGCNCGAGSGNCGMHLDRMERFVEDRMRARRELWRSKGHSEKSALKKLNRMIDSYWRPELYSRTYTDRSRYFSGHIKTPSADEIQKIMADMHKHGSRDILNCGSCGYDSCRQLAVAVFNGVNRPENCRHYLDIQKGITGEIHREELRNSVRKVAETSADRLSEAESDIAKLVEVSHDMSRSVEAASAVIGKMIEGIGSVDGILSRNTEAVSGLDAATREGQTNIEKITALVGDIEENSRGLEEMSAVIRQIAGQTNLLAMNAAIEAAHAGDSGRGFAVVAEEIRKLAENSGKEAKMISDVLKKVKALIDSTFTTTGEASGGFKKVVELSRTVVEQEFNVKNAMSEQSAGGKQVLDATAAMNGLVRTVMDAAEKLQADTRQIRDNIRSMGAE